MNSKEFVNNTEFSVLLLYIAGSEQLMLVAISFPPDPGKDACPSLNI